MTGGCLLFSREKTQASKFSPPKNLKNTQKTNQTNKIHTQNKQTNKPKTNQKRGEGWVFLNAWFQSALYQLGCMNCPRLVWSSLWLNHKVCSKCHMSDRKTVFRRVLVFCTGSKCSDVDALANVVVKIQFCALPLWAKSMEMNVRMCISYFSPRSAACIKLLQGCLLSWAPGFCTANYLESSNKEEDSDSMRMSR